MLLQPTGVPSNTSFARLITPFPELKDFTVCYRIRIQRFREESTLMSYAISSKEDNELRMDHRTTGYKVSLHSKWANSKIQTPLRQWTHFCFRYGFRNGNWVIFMNGEMSDSGNLPKTTLPLKPDGAYIIGQEQDELGGGFQRDQSFCGEITQLNFWSRELDETTIQRMAECSDLDEGNALPWTEKSWKISGDVTWVTYKQDDICSNSKRRLAVFPDHFTLARAIHICEVFGGIVAVPENEKENEWLFSSSKDDAPYCSKNVGASYLWLGADDTQEEGVWRYLEKNETLPWPGNWRGDGPNGGKVENCMVMQAGSFPSAWSDIACLDSYEFCVPCEFEELAVLYLKGPSVCPGSPFNLEYFLGEKRGGRPSLIGFFHSDIYWDTEMEAWVLKSLKEEAIAWWKPPRKKMYPYGKNVWTMGSKICNIDIGETTNLTISVCGEGLFTCKDGTCIDLTKRCDLRADCSDQSDEASCSLLDIPSGYMANIPPPPVTENEPLPVMFMINIISFPSIETEDLTFVTSLELKLRWQDVRLTYLNLKDDRSLNVLSEAAVSQIWKPRVFFSNAQGNVFSNLKEGSRIECIRDGKSTIGPPHLEEEVNTFSGQENSLEMGQLYSVTYTCDFNLQMFPFDAQVCNLRFTLVSATTSYMTLLPTNASYSGPPNLIEYSIGHVTTEMINLGEFSHVDVQVRFRRRYGFYMLTLYIPTTLIIITAYTTFFFNPYDFNSRIVVALTSQLVLSSLYTQTSNSLPKTSYFKLVDIWLFFAIVMIFIVVLLQTLIDFSAQGDFSWKDGCLSKIAGILSRKPPASAKKNGFTRDESRCATGILSCCKPEGQVEGIKIRVAGVHGLGNIPSTRNWNAPLEPSALPDYSPFQRGSNSQVQSPKVNKSMMSKSRLFIPALFLVFNGIYWGTAIKYLNSLDENEAEL
ncbi:uncharacterized protein [Palaemon carinicauda]|uniref:uncharacterized protein n=1 Tax=Palaemon carinicauda TaxID=392227 RepID=UPI0035B6080F